MAQHITDESRRLESRDAHELELLLDEEEQAVRAVEAKKDPLKKLLRTLEFPKEWALVAVFTIAGLAGAGYWIWVAEPAKQGISIKPRETRCGRISISSHNIFLQ